MGALPSTLAPPSIRPFTEAVAALSRDEHWLFFTSDRPVALEVMTSGSRIASTRTTPSIGNPQ